MRTILILLLIISVKATFSQQPELSMEMNLYQDRDELLPFTVKEILNFKTLNIKEVSIKRSEKEIEVYTLNKLGKPVKRVDYYIRRRNKREIENSTTYKYSDADQITSITYRRKSTLSIDSFTYDQKQLVGIYFKSTDYLDREECNEGVLDNYQLIKSSKNEYVFSDSICGRVRMLYLDSNRKFIKQVEREETDSVSIIKDTSFYWLKVKGQPSEMVKKTVYKDGYVLYTETNSMKMGSVLIIRKDYAYDSKKQLVSSQSPQGGGSEFFTYTPSGLVRTRMEVSNSPEWKYNYFLDWGTEVYSNPIIRYTYKTFEGKSIY